jgi:excisionase family DNA binding protein
MKDYLTTSEAAKILGISRIAVFKRIKKGTLPAKKIGNSYIIASKDLGLKTGEPTAKMKERIAHAVRRVVDEYADALKKLGKE